MICLLVAGNTAPRVWGAFTDCVPAAQVQHMWEYAAMESEHVCKQQVHHHRRRQQQQQQQQQQQPAPADAVECFGNSIHAHSMATKKEMGELDGLLQQVQEYCKQPPKHLVRRQDADALPELNNHTGAPLLNKLEEPSLVIAHDAHQAVSTAEVPELLHSDGQGQLQQPLPALQPAQGQPQQLLLEQCEQRQQQQKQQQPLQRGGGKAAHQPSSPSPNHQLPARRLSLLPGLPLAAPRTRQVKLLDAHSAKQALGKPPAAVACAITGGRAGAGGVAAVVPEPRAEHHDRSQPGNAVQAGTGSPSRLLSKHPLCPNLPKHPHCPNLPQHPLCPNRQLLAGDLTKAGFRAASSKATRAGAAAAAATVSGRWVGSQKKEATDKGNLLSYARWMNPRAKMSHLPSRQHTLLQSCTILLSPNGPGKPV